MNKRNNRPVALIVFFAVSMVAGIAIATVIADKFVISTEWVRTGMEASFTLAILYLLTLVASDLDDKNHLVWEYERPPFDWESKPIFWKIEAKLDDEFDIVRCKRKDTGEIKYIRLQTDKTQSQSGSGRLMWGGNDSTAYCKLHIDE